MSPRVNRRRPDPSAARRASREDETVQTGPDGDWVVRAVTGAGAGRVYRCPGCDQEIAPATPHVVAWPSAGGGGVEDRRHWHRPCWAARSRRGARVQRSRDAPRYG